MKAKDLPKDTNLQAIKLRLPKSVLKQFKAYAGGEPKMYPAGYFWGTFMLSPQPMGHKPERRLYPMPENIAPADILEWEIC